MRLFIVLDSSSGTLISSGRHAFRGELKGLHLLCAKDNNFLLSNSRRILSSNLVQLRSMMISKLSLILATYTFIQTSKTMGLTLNYQAMVFVNGCCGMGLSCFPGFRAHYPLHYCVAYCERDLYASEAPLELDSL